MFKQYERNIYSQHGEDGVLEEIFKRLGVEDSRDRWCVEVGAWDGKRLSNTFYLVSKGWSSVMIEGDADKYQSLLKTAKEFKNIHPINKYVSQYNTEKNSLDKLLKTTKIPNHFEFLSIDVDSYDADIWKTLYEYSAKIVCIEINSAVGPNVYWSSAVSSDNQLSRGATFSEMLDVGKSKGYTLVCQTGDNSPVRSSNEYRRPRNCIFVRNDVVGLLNLPTIIMQSPELLFWER